MENSYYQLYVRMSSFLNSDSRIERYETFRDAYDEVASLSLFIMEQFGVSLKCEKYGEMMKNVYDIKSDDGRHEIHAEIEWIVEKEDINKY